jgi:hypothetical protein
VRTEPTLAEIQQPFVIEARGRKPTPAVEFQGKMQVRPLNGRPLGWIIARWMQC